MFLECFYSKLKQFICKIYNHGPNTTYPLWPRWFRYPDSEKNLIASPTSLHLNHKSTDWFNFFTDQCIIKENLAELSTNPSKENDTSKAWTGVNVGWCKSGNVFPVLETFYKNLVELLTYEQIYLFLVDLPGWTCINYFANLGISLELW